MKEHLDVLLATSAVAANNAKGRHWLITGRNFSSNHLLLDEIYNTLRDGVDMIAETLVILGHTPPTTLSNFTEMSAVENNTTVHNSDGALRDTLIELEGIVDYINENVKLGVFDPTIDSDLTAFSSKLRHHILFLKGTIN